MTPRPPEQIGPGEPDDSERADTSGAAPEHPIEDNVTRNPNTGEFEQFTPFDELTTRHQSPWDWQLSELMRMTNIRLTIQEIAESQQLPVPETLLPPAVTPPRIPAAQTHKWWARGLEVPQHQTTIVRTEYLVYWADRMKSPRHFDPCAQLQTVQQERRTWWNNLFRHTRESIDQDCRALRQSIRLHQARVDGLIIDLTIPVSYHEGSVPSNTTFTTRRFQVWARDVARVFEALHNHSSKYGGVDLDRRQKFKLTTPAVAERIVSLAEALQQAVQVEACIRAHELAKQGTWQRHPDLHVDLQPVEQLYGQLLHAIHRHGIEVVDG